MKRILTMTLVAVLAVGACGADGETDATRDDEGNITENDEIGVFRLRTGDCLMLPGSDTEVETLEAVPCDQPHDAEVVGLHEMPEGSSAAFPGTDVVIDESRTVCLSMFDDVTGLDFVTDPDWDLTSLYPTEESWRLLDDREIVCLAVPLDGVATTQLLPRV